MNKSLIIFDLDGTLIDSAPDLAEAIDAMLAHFGAPRAGVRQVRNWVGNGSQTLVARALAWAMLPDTLLPHAHEVFLQKYATCHDKTQEYQGVSEGLQRLKEHGFTLALCTNKPARFLPDILAKMGWQDTFAHIIGGDSLPTKKPDPAPLLHICGALGVVPIQALMVGDSKNDIQAGKNAGMDTFALSYGYNYGKPISDSAPDGIFDDFGSLVARILADNKTQG